MRSRVNNLVSHNLAMNVRKGVHTVRYKERRYLASCLLSIISPTPSACYKYFNEQVHRECGGRGEREDRARNDGMRSLHRYVLSTNQSSFSSLSAVLSRGRPVSRETSRVRRNNRCCSPSAPALHFQRRCRMDAGAFRVSGRVPQVFSILIEMLATVLRCGTRVGRLLTRVTKQCPLPACTMTERSSRRPVIFSCFLFYVFQY